MESYFYLLVFVVFSFFLSFFNEKLRVLPFVVLALFSGFRYNVGIDFPTYQLLYEYAQDGSQVTSEPFFQYFIKICYFLGGNEQMFFLLSAIITNYLVYNYIKKNSYNYVLSVLLYLCIVSFYLYTFNAIRQWIACSIFLYSLEFLKNNEQKKFIIVNVIGALFFHMSLLFITVLTFLGNKDVMIKYRKLGYVVAVLVGVFTKVLLQNSLYGDYVEATFDSSIDMKMYLFFVISLILEVFRDKIMISQDKWERLLVNINYLSILILIILFLQSSGSMILMFKRIHNYYFAVYIIYIPFVLNGKLFSFKIKKILMIIMYIVLPILFLLTVYVNGEFMEVLPYNFNLNIFK